MDIETWYTIQSEKSVAELFLRTEIETKTNWTIGSYQNPAEIQSRFDTIFTEGLGSGTETEIFVLRYSYGDDTEPSLSDPIPVVMNERGDSSRLATVNFFPEGTIRVCPETIESDVWAAFNELLESVPYGTR